MRKLLAGAAIAALLSTSAFAQGAMPTQTPVQSTMPMTSDVRLAGSPVRSGS